MLQEGKPLVPIHFVIASEAIPNITSIFEPNWDSTIKKQGFSITNAEIRITYKLMKELDDPLINEIMEKTVSFHKRKEADKFEVISPPWEVNDNGVSWKGRTRTEDKLSYKDRGPDYQFQPWLKEFKELSKETSKLLSEKAVSQNNVVLHQQF